MSDDWKERVDRQLHGDARTLLRLGPDAVVGLAALFGGLYLRTDGKSEAIDNWISRVEVQRQRLKGGLDFINAKLDALLERTAPGKR